MAESTPLSKPEKTVVALGLTLGAGTVDVVGYLALSHAFVAHMTGNTVSTVLHSVEGKWSEVFHRGMPIPAFMLGLFVAEIILEVAHRHNRKRVVSRALALEALSLAAFLVCMGFMHPSTAASFAILVSLIAIAMGIQSASMRKVGALTIFTTFMTGTLTKLAKDLSEYLFWLRDRTHGRFRERIGTALRLSLRQESFQSVLLLAGIYLCYALGAWAGSEAFGRIGAWAVSGPLALVLAALVTDIIRPMQPAP